MKIELVEFLEKFEDKDDPFNRASVDACQRFLNANEDLTSPDIVASPNGTIICQWRKDENRNLTIEFLKDGSVHFVLFAPKGSKTIRVQLSCSLDEVRQKIKPFGAESWVCKNG